MSERDPSSFEVNLSLGLIAGAIVIIAGVIWAIFGFMEKLNFVGQVIVAIISCIGAISLISSIMFGGRAIVEKITPGAGNGFDRQAKLMLCGTVLLMTAPVVGLFFEQKQELPLAARILALEQAVDSLRDSVLHAEKNDSKQMESLERRVSKLELTSKQQTKGQPQRQNSGLDH